MDEIFSSLLTLVVVLAPFALFGWLGIRLAKRNNWPYWIVLVLGIIGSLIGCAVSVWLAKLLIPH